MIRVLIDTNVVLDFLLRRPDYAVARKMVVFSAVGDFELWISSSQVTDVHYMVSDRGKKSRSQQAQRAIMRLRKRVNVVSLGAREVDLALECQRDDFEDSLLHQAAVNIGASAIVTRNADDFSRSSIPAVTPEDFFDWFKSRHGITYDGIAF
jgi:predicted nucleic acid-binding protein